MKRLIPLLLTPLLLSLPATLLESRGEENGPPTPREPAMIQPADLEKAKALFEQYKALEDDFNPKLADLYAENALIKSTRKDPIDGSLETIHIPASRYKLMIQQLMPLAKAKKDQGRYSRITYTPETPNVRISAKRYSVNNKYTAPLVLLVGPDPSRADRWVIFEEHSEIHP